MSHSEKDKSSPTDKNNKKKHIKPVHIIGILLMIIAGAIITRFLPLPDQTGTSSTISSVNTIKPNSVKKNTNHTTAAPEQSPLEIKTAYELDKVNQSILYARISYIQLLTQKNIESALEWLDLSFQLIKEAGIKNDTAILHEITSIRDKIKQIEKPNLNTIQQLITDIQNDIASLSHPKTSATTPYVTTKKADPANTTQTILDYFDSLYMSLLNWINNSISVQKINQNTYQTLHNTLNSDDFSKQAAQLAREIQIAAEYQNENQFHYLCKQLSLLVEFHIHEPSIRDALLEKIQSLANQPVEIIPPSFKNLLALLNQDPSSQSISTSSPNSETVKTELSDHQPKPQSIEAQLSTLNIQEMTT